MKIRNLFFIVPILSVISMSSYAQTSADEDLQKALLFARCVVAYDIISDDARNDGRDVDRDLWQAEADGALIASWAKLFDGVRTANEIIQISAAEQKRYYKEEWADLFKYEQRDKIITKLIEITITCGRLKVEQDILVQQMIKMFPELGLK